MLARLGLAEARLASGDLAQAGEQAALVMDDASTLGNSVVHGLACEAAARIAMARGTLERAEELVRKASEIADTPVVAWRAHATSWELNRRLKRAAEAERQRAGAEKLVLQLAQSFDARDPLRQSLLAAEPVRKILRQPTSVTDTGPSHNGLASDHQRLPIRSRSKPRQGRRVGQH
jgi:ATP/maltotriose-dependent transcriptional regulator MalT